MNTNIITTFRATSMPYVLEKQKDGSYLVLNRNYKPIGFQTREWIHYEDYPIAHHFFHLGPKTIKKLCVGGRRQGRRIYLYGDSTSPRHGGKYRRAYLDKIGILMDLGVYGMDE